MEEIKKHIRAIGEIAKQTEEYKKFQDAQKVYDSDSKLQVMLIQFNRFRDELYAARDEEKIDKNKVIKLQQDMQALYTEIMSMKSMQEYTESRNAFEEYSEKLQKLLMTELFGASETGCTGSCASCAGCH